MIVRHYKGEHYVVCGEAMHTESEEALTIYTDGKGNVWARPTEMFEGYTKDGKKRFVAITAEDIPDVKLSIQYAHFDAEISGHTTCEDAQIEAREWNERTSTTNE